MPGGVAEPSGGVSGVGSGLNICSRANFWFWRPTTSLLACSMATSSALIWVRIRASREVSASGVGLLTIFALVYRLPHEKAAETGQNGLDGGGCVHGLGYEAADSGGYGHQTGPCRLLFVPGLTHNRFSCVECGCAASGTGQPAPEILLLSRVFTCILDVMRPLKVIEELEEGVRAAVIAPEALFHGVERGRPEPPIDLDIGIGCLVPVEEVEGILKILYGLSHPHIDCRIEDLVGNGLVGDGVPVDAVPEGFLVEEADVLLEEGVGVEAVVEAVYARALLGVHNLPANPPRVVAAGNAPVGFAAGVVWVAGVSALVAHGFGVCYVEIGHKMPSV